MSKSLGAIAITALITTVIICGLIGMTSYKSGYEEGHQDAKDRMSNPFDCYEWDGYVCVDQESPYACCSIVRQTCSGDLCPVEAI